jgi:glutamate---cysteine ligase / carboxylate-amine ligase
VQIEFRGSPAPTLGVEMELSLVDRETLGLRSSASELLAELGAPHGGVHPTAKHELFESIIEVITGVCSTVGEARADLSATIAEVGEVADRHHLDLISCGTHPFSHWRDLVVSPDPRYHELVRSIGWPARRLAICGVHVHVGVPDGARAAALVNSLAFHLPIFLALSASSPYWHGSDTGMASCRTKIFEGLPTAGLPPNLDDWSDFERFMTSLINARVISTVRDVWWDVRPHPDFGTVELRMCDGIPTLDETMAIAALAQCLVVDLAARRDAGEPLPVAREWVLRQNKWLAARHGLDTSFLVDDRGSRIDARELVAGTAASLMPMAESLGCADELAHVTVMLDQGPSYVRQRALVSAGGSHRDVVAALVEELRPKVPAT